METSYEDSQLAEVAAAFQWDSLSFPYGCPQLDEMDKIHSASFSDFSTVDPHRSLRTFLPLEQCEAVPSTTSETFCFDQLRSK